MKLEKPWPWFCVTAPQSASVPRFRERPIKHSRYTTSRKFLDIWCSSIKRTILLTYFQRYGVRLFETSPENNHAIPVLLESPIYRNFSIVSSIFHAMNPLERRNPHSIAASKEIRRRGTGNEWRRRRGRIGSHAERRFPDNSAGVDL